MKAIEKRRQMRGQSGFTLIELLVVIAILGILAGVVVFAVSGSTDDARLNACKVEKRTFETAIEAANASEDATDTAASFLRSTTGKYWSVSGTTLGAGTETKPAGCS
ncbi:MAG TPA: type II secretion system protein [Microthrixaceae bacterium]|jgi:prepilin-type N-terminal cleavage/methylation domain-containing protein|nr:type II secretion system protein [Microthrixaceae bacterium]HMT26142.1 type II secretion system protein [Microthrixaceae bacterium]HMT62412.1 type II secretion system protein [Microthrixaceae bacterium]